LWAQPAAVKPCNESPERNTIRVSHKALTTRVNVTVLNDFIMTLSFYAWTTAVE
jgi:hypothetical protein